MERSNAGDSVTTVAGCFCTRLAARFLFLFAALSVSTGALAQKAVSQPDGDEIIVQLDFKGLGSGEMPAFFDNKNLYLSVQAVFDFLKIRNIPSLSFDSIKGFYINEQDSFAINYRHKTVRFKDKEFDLSSKGLVLMESALYMNLKYYDSIFGLKNTFSFRRLIVSMKSDVELPVIREMRQELMRKNINKLRGETKADTTIPRAFPMFRFGMADWAAMASRQSGGADQLRLNSSIGGMLAGGEASASLNYNYGQAFIPSTQFYQWRFVNNDFAPMRQLLAGKMYAQSTASVFAPMTGVQITNAPTIARQSYGTFTLSNSTQPGWVVELYVNDVLVDYTKADASGLFTFQVPLVYGLTIVKLKFYGPYGEERSSQQFINIPFNFLPQKVFEYQATAGVVDDGINSKFSRVKLNYGLTKAITLGVGAEYLSSVTTGSFMPFMSASVRLGPQLLFSGEYTEGVRTKGVFSYRLPSGLQIDEDFTEFVPGQKAIFFNYLQESKTIMTMPLHPFGLSVFTRLTADQVVAPTTTYTNTEWAIAGFYRTLGINLTTFASVTQNTIPYFYSMVALSSPLPSRILFTSQLQYDYKHNDLMSMKFTFEKHIMWNGFLNVSLQDYFNSGNFSALVGVRCEMNAARFSASILEGNNNNYSQVLAASGSLIDDVRTHYLHTTNRNSVGKAAVVIIPYLDLNGNGRRDDGEPITPGLIVRLNGGRIVYDEHDTTIRIFDLQPYSKYVIELDRNSFDNIAWQIRKKSLLVITNPDMFTEIEVPVQVAQEVEGVVKTVSKDGRNKKGQGQIKMCIYDDSGIVARTVSESDGFFSYLGLSAGNFRVAPDTAQLRKLNMVCTPAFRPVHFDISRDGGMVDGLEFSLLSLDEDTTQPAVVPVKKDTGTVPAVAKQKGTSKQNSTGKLAAGVKSGKSKVARDSLAQSKHNPDAVAASKNAKAGKKGLKPGSADQRVQDAGAGNYADSSGKLAAGKAGKAKPAKDSLAKAGTAGMAGAGKSIEKGKPDTGRMALNGTAGKGPAKKTDTVATGKLASKTGSRQPGADTLTKSGSGGVAAAGKQETHPEKEPARAGYAKGDSAIAGRTAKVATRAEKPITGKATAVAQAQRDTVFAPVKRDRIVYPDSSIKTDRGNYIIMADVVADENRATHSAKRLERLSAKPVQVLSYGDDYLVEVVGLQQEKEAEQLARKLVRYGYIDAIVQMLKSKVK